MNRDISSQVIQMLSEYLDGTLSTKERIQIEERLRSAPELQKELEELRRTRILLRHLPQKRAPRNFFITPAMLPQKPARQLFPIFRLASALAAILMVLVFAGDFLLGSAILNPASELAPLAQSAQQESATSQVNASAPIIIWGTPPEQAPAGATGLGGGAPDNLKQSGIPAVTTPTEPVNSLTGPSVPAEPTLELGGGAPTPALQESTNPAMAAAPVTTPASTEQQRALTGQTSVASQDQYQSGPIL
jgi:hypothetical protein